MTAALEDGEIVEALGARGWVRMRATAEGRAYLVDKRGLPWAGLREGMPSGKLDPAAEGVLWRRLRAARPVPRARPALNDALGALGLGEDLAAFFGDSR